MFDQIKSAAVPGALAYLGVRFASGFGVKSPLAQAAIGVAAATGGVLLARKIKA